MPEPIMDCSHPDNILRILKVPRSKFARSVMKIGGGRVFGEVSSISIMYEAWHEFIRLFLASHRTIGVSSTVKHRFRFAKSPQLSFMMREQTSSLVSPATRKAELLSSDVEPPTMKKLDIHEVLHAFGAAADVPLKERRNCLLCSASLRFSAAPFHGDFSR